MCCIRNPLGGRNFETFSEDPFLTGTLATQYVAGLQHTGEVLATAKLLYLLLPSENGQQANTCGSVAHEQEYKRFSVDTLIDDAALHEIYLRPFEMLVKSSTPPGCIMTAYNKVNNLHMEMQKSILGQTLRHDWRFQGLVMSDWGGTNSTVESVLAGCDLEMPGPALIRGKKLLDALTADDSREIQHAIDASCRRLLSYCSQLNSLGLSEKEVNASRARPERSETSVADM